MLSTCVCTPPDQVLQQTPQRIYTNGLTDLVIYNTQFNKTTTKRQQNDKHKLNKPIPYSISGLVYCRRPVPYATHYMPNTERDTDEHSLSETKCPLGAHAHSVQLCVHLIIQIGSNSNENAHTHTRIRTYAHSTHSLTGRTNDVDYRWIR